LGIGLGIVGERRLVKITVSQSEETAGKSQGLFGNFLFLQNKKAWPIKTAMPSKKLYDY
jgi:hypothetical protein